MTYERVTRRKALALIAGAAAALGGMNRARAARSHSSCVVRPRAVEGPFFVDTTLNRSDIRSDPGSSLVKHGTPLRLTFRVSQMDGNRCFPLQGAQVDLWQCDA